MRDQVGLQVGAGVAKGIEKSRNQVKAAMSGLNDEIVDNPVPEVSGISGKTGKGSRRDGDIYITVPLTMDGQTVTRKTSRIQYRNNKTFSRTKGVVPT